MLYCAACAAGVALLACLALSRFALLLLAVVRACAALLMSCRLTVPCPTVLHDTAFFRAFSLMSSCVGIRSLLAFRSPEHGGAGEAMLGGCRVLRCEGRADMCSLFFAKWRMVMAVCHPWFSQLKVRVTLRCLLLVSRALSRGGSLMIRASMLRALLVQL